MCSTSIYSKEQKEIIDKHIAEMCADCPERLEQCKRFQWRIEQDLSKFKNPIARYNAMVELFWEQTEKFQSALQMDTPKKPESTASVIQFPRKE